MFVDGDDRLEPECVEVMLDLLNKHGADVSVCNELRFCYREDQSIEILPDQYREVEDEKEYTAQQGWNIRWDAFLKISGRPIGSLQSAARWFLPIESFIAICSVQTVWRIAFR